MKLDASSDAAPRRYHHGNLREALVDEGLAVTRSGGPAALTLRDVARRLGVSPNAAYRHFADRHALLVAVVARIQQHIADDMQQSTPSVQADADAAAAAVAMLRGVGLGYIDFALSEPGWFDVAFDPVWLAPEQLATPPAPLAALLAALDALVECGAITAQHRPGLEWACWSAVHGFALLALHGPLRDMPHAHVRREAEQTVDVVIRGVLAGAGAAGAHNRPRSSSFQ